MCKCSNLSLLILSGVLSVIFICIFLGLFFGGFVKHDEWNENAISTTCVITKNEVREDTCYYQCNCRRTCTGSGSKRTCSRTCDSCPYTCYDGYVTYSWIAQNERSYYDTKKQINNKDNYNYVDDKLNENYAVDSDVMCYYQKDDHHDMKLKLQDPVVFLVFASIFACLGGVALIVAIVFGIMQFFC